MSATVDRRSRKDRRVLDLGPPKGWLERRKSVERRLPSAQEAEISADEFVRYFGSARIAANSNDSMLDLAAEVFSRVRDGY